MGVIVHILRVLVLRALLESRHAALCVPVMVASALRFGCVPLKDRHVFTRHGRMRLRYVVTLLLGFFAVSTLDFSFDRNPPLDMKPAYAGMLNIPAPIATKAELMAQVAPQAGAGIAVKQASFQQPMAKALEAPLSPPKPRPATSVRTLRVGAGDTLSQLLEEAQISGDIGQEALKKLRAHIDPKDLKIGQNLLVHYRWTGKADEWTHLEFSKNGLETVILRNGKKGLSVEETTKPLMREMRAVRAKISSSLYSDLKRAGVPDSILATFIKAYSYNIDFQRDIWSGDVVEILYSVTRTEDAKVVRGGELVYANLTSRGKSNAIYRFERDGDTEYFDERGQSVRKSLLRTPIDGARVTSGFGMRRHPILGYSKMHKGVDFGAPTGTPIFAAGDGVIQFAGWSGGYGQYVKIKHNNTYSTAYGHMSRILVKPGQRVKQGDVIGRVGSTGRSTGPHLHFEVLSGGTQINPTSASVAIGNKLLGKSLARFQNVSNQVRDQFDNLIETAHVQNASAKTGKSPVSKTAGLEPVTIAD